MPKLIYIWHESQLGEAKLELMIVRANDVPGAFEKIVENMTLKLSSFTLLNDLNEDELSCESSGGMDAINIRNYIREHCRLICFTQNFESESGFAEF